MFEDHPDGQNEGGKKKRCTVRTIAIIIVIIAGGIAAGGFGLAVTQKNKSSDESSVKEVAGDGDGGGGRGDKPDEKDDTLYSETSLLYNSEFVNNPSNSYMEASLSLYTKYLLSDPKNVSYTLSIDFAEKSTINTALDDNHNIMHDKNSLCFTDNLYLLERNLVNDDDIHVKHPTDKNMTEPVTTKMNNVMTTTSDHNFCIHHIDKFSFPHELPPDFIPEHYGAVAIVWSAAAVDGAAESPPQSSHSVGNLFYNATSQRSMFPTVTTELISTSEVYKISGNIGVLGKIGRISNEAWGDDLYDKAVMWFEKIDLYPQPPALFLYLTRRSAWMRFSDDDIFLDMLGDGEIWPAGSFHEEGSFSHPWPLGERVDIRDYLEKCNWFLWCTTFSVTLAGGAIEVVQEY